MRSHLRSRDEVKRKREMFRNRGRGGIGALGEDKNGRRKKKGNCPPEA